MNFLFKTLFLLCLLPFTSFAEEEVKISLDVKQKEIEAILKEIETQTGLSFTYESSLFKTVKKVSIHVENESLESCLDKLLTDLKITYTIQGRFIILKKQTSLVTISGFVRAKNSGEPLINASVLERYSRQGTPTNEDGFFSFAVGTGNIQLDVSYIGFYSFQNNFRYLLRDTIIDIYLEENAFLSEIIVTGNKESHDPVLSSQMGALKVSQAIIKTMPTLLGEADVVKTLQTLPGVSPGVEGFSGMYVRGGNGDENLFLVDGNPLYQVSHLGGLFSSFNADAIQDMEFYKGAFPARFGGRLSSVVDITTQEGNLQEYRGSASLGLTSGNIHLNGPLIKNKTGINVAVRRSWFDAFSAPALAIVNSKDKKNGLKTIARYAFTDLNLRLDHHFNPDNRAYITMYWGDDVFKWGEEFFRDEYEKTHGFENYNNKNVSKLRWGNLMTSAGWIHRFHPNTVGDFSVVFSRYRSKLRNEIFDSSGDKGSGEYEETFTQMDIENGISDMGLKALFDYTFLSSHHIRYGATYYNYQFRPEYINNKYSGDAEVPVSRFTNQRLSANQLNIYIEDDWSINKVIRLSGGVRFSLYNIGNKTYNSLEPRLSGRFLLKEDLSMKLSYARMNQYVHQLSDNYINFPTDMWLPVSEKFKPLSSDQVAAGLYYSLNNGYSFALEGYYKWMNNLLDYKDGHNFLPSFLGWENKLESGKGWSYGLELMARKEKGNITGWVGYGLMWADRQFEQINDGKRYPAKYDNRHKINVVANWKLTPKVELTGSWIYMTGNRITLSLEEYAPMDKTGPLEYYEGRNNFRLPAYHRMDLGINIYRPTKKGRMGIWTLSIYNVYSRFNPITIHQTDKQVGEYEFEPCFKTFSFLPIIPSVSYTLKF